MIEPTETESRRDLDLFIDAMKKIADEVAKKPEMLKSAPYTSYVRRLDETRAARNPILRWDETKNTKGQSHLF
jgi:glycine dehydrogenase subunit 2